MRQLAFEPRTYQPYSPAASGRPGFPRSRMAWAVLSALAALALFMTIAGPGITHHYAEFTPFHAHVYLGTNTVHEHGAEASIYHVHNGEMPDVVSTSGDAGMSAGIAGFNIAPPVDRGLVEPDGLWQPVTESSVIYSSPEPDQPDRPPITS